MVTDTAAATPETVQTLVAQLPTVALDVSLLIQVHPLLGTSTVAPVLSFAVAVNVTLLFAPTMVGPVTCTEAIRLAMVRAIGWLPPLVNVVFVVARAKDVPMQELLP
jgi:hypothetical protein